MITINGYYANISTLTPDELETIKAQLTITPKVCPGYGDDKVDPYILYSFPWPLSHPTIIKLPLHYGICHFGAPAREQLKDAPHIIATDMAPSTAHPLRDYQLAIIGKYMAAVEGKTCGGGIISVGCGKGKTVMALHIAARMRVKTLILVHKEFLAVQWRDRALQFIPKVRIGYIQGKSFDVNDKDIVIGMIQSLSNANKDSDYPLSIFKEFGLLIADECHHLGARQFSRVLNKWTIPFTLGLSATPKRGDGCDPVFHAYLGDFIYKDPALSKSVGISPDAIVHVYQYELNDTAYCHEHLNYKRKPDTIRMESNIVNAARRTGFVISRIIGPLVAPESGRKILILSSRIAHIMAIRTALEAILPAGDIGLYIGGMKQSQLDASTLCRVIIATYNMAEEAFDCPALNTLIMMTPKKNIQQAVGRILRQKKEDRTIMPLVIDIADMFSSFTNWLRIRRKFYTANHYDIITYKIYDGGSDELPTIPLESSPPEHDVIFNGDSAPDQEFNYE